MAIDKVTDFDQQNLPVINKILRALDADKWQVRYFDNAPTVSDLNIGQVGFYEVGGGIARIYYKAPGGTVYYWASDGTL